MNPGTKMRRLRWIAIGRDEGQRAMDVACCVLRVACCVILIPNPYRPSSIVPKVTRAPGLYSYILIRHLRLTLVGERRKSINVVTCYVIGLKSS